MPERRLKLGAGFMIILSLFAFLVVFPLVSSASASKKLAERSAPYLKRDMPMMSVEYNEPSLIWYFRKYLRSWPKTISLEAMRLFARENGPRVCVLPTELVKDLFDTIPSGWQLVSADGFNIAKGKPVHLTALIKPD